MPVRIAVSAMRTRFEFVLDGGAPAFLRGVAEEAADEVRRTEAELSRFRRDSFMAHVVREAARGPVVLPADLFELLERCHAVHRDSGGAFDLTVAPLLHEHGFEAPRDGPSAAATTGAAPVDPTGRAGSVAGMTAVQLDPRTRTVRFTDASVTLDFGAVGKGLALERAAAVLHDAGVPRALLHGGTSSVLALGAPPREDAWRVALRDPRDPQRTVATVTLRDRALSVSAPHGRRRGAAGHIMDPRRGVPADRVLLAAVVHRRATEADAWSTALTVHGAMPGSRHPHLVVARDGTVAAHADPDHHFILEGPAAVARVPGMARDRGRAAFPGP